MTAYREVLFELVDGRPVTPLFQALVAERTARARLQAISMTERVVSVLIDYAGPPLAVARLRDVLVRRPEVTVLTYDTLIDDEKQLRFLATWTRPQAPQQGVSLEHILFDTVGPAGLLFGRVHNGVIAYKAAAPGGRGLNEFLQRVQEQFGTRFTVHAVRTGPFRSGWEIEESARRVDPDEEALLAAAFAAGYYDEPKRCGVRELGDVLGLSKSVIARRLRAIERRALEQLVH